MRRFLVSAATALALVGFTGVSTASVGAATPFCGIMWGSLPKSDPDFTSARINDLRTGRHACFDRLVVDLGPEVPGLLGPDEPGYQVGYVEQVTRDGSGEAVPVAGGAALSVVVHANAFDDDGIPTFSPGDPLHAAGVAGFRTFRQVAFLGTFEGYTTIGLGVRARLPFRVFLLAGPGDGQRLVIDVAHRW